jgi:hypothetical protein
MSKKNLDHENKNINKVEEPIVEYNVEKNAVQKEELHPVLVKLLEKSIKNHEEGNVISHDDAMRRIKERYPFLK